MKLLFLFSILSLISLASATSGTTYCASNIAEQCQNSCSVKNCLTGSCRTQPNAEQPSCVCGLCFNGRGHPNGPFVMSEDTGNLAK
uniref:TIL domain-containing protein n=1 Tax=Caenorhabditis tropicalis TaxID=1561998 RepID=A0A1I7UK50_9PELO